MRIILIFFKIILTFFLFIASGVILPSVPVGMRPYIAGIGIVALVLIWVFPRPSKPTKQFTGQQFSNAQPVWHFVLLSIVTFGIYEIYWFYRNWVHLKFHKNLNIKPGWRTAGLFVPIYGLVLIYRQLRDIRNFAKEAGVDKTYSPGWILFGLIIFNIFWRLPFPFYFLSLLEVLPLAVVQGVLNSYWKKEQPDLPIRTKFSGEEITLLIIGGIILILGVVSVTFIP